MKTTKLFVSAVLFPFILQSQTVSLSMKEQYDHLLDEHMEPSILEHYEYHNLVTNDDHLCLGDGMSYVLASYLNMYEATKDKAY